jgi:hypothetical protein
MTEMRTTDNGMTGESGAVTTVWCAVDGAVGLAIDVDGESLQGVFTTMQAMQIMAQLGAAITKAQDRQAEILR